VEGLIDIENPNRVAQTTKKVTQLDLDGPKELSRRERYCLLGRLCDMSTMAGRGAGWTTEVPQWLGGGSSYVISVLSHSPKALQ
jgi:hypothetical protein